MAGVWSAVGETGCRVSCWWWWRVARMCAMVSRAAAADILNCILLVSGQIALCVSYVQTIKRASPPRTRRQQQAFRQPRTVGQRE
jgi:hypothetical protein